MEKKKEFKIQIPTDHVRNKDLTAKEFVMLGKLVDAYYLPKHGEKSLNLNIRYKDLMHYAAISDNDTFKKILNGLHRNGIIINKVDVLPRKGGLEIQLDEKVVPGLKKKKGYFTQLPFYVLSRYIIEAVGEIGVRLLYYYMSRINIRETSKLYCFASIELIAEEIGLSEKTIIRYNKILADHKFIKIEKHKTEHDLVYNPASGRESYLFFKYNNHYTLQIDEVKKYHQKCTAVLM